MSRVSSSFLAVAALAAAVGSPSATKGVDVRASPISEIRIPAGYRSWKLISVAHEEGDLNDLRAVLGNDIAFAALREGKRSLPDGAIVARLAWRYVSSDENNRAFGRECDRSDAREKRHPNEVSPPNLEPPRSTDTIV